MAGLNTRFHDAGVDCPKYLLPWKNESVITEILEQLTLNFNFKEIILLANKRDSYFKNKLRIATDKFGVHIHYIGDTIGQADTAAIGATISNYDGPILIHNADTILFNRNIKCIQDSLLVNDAYIDVFLSENPAYCYLNTYQGKIRNINEKKSVTGKASSGLYGFKSAQYYKQNFLEVVKTNVESEIYISDVLTKILNDGGSIGYDKVQSSDDTIVIGSPKEYWEAATCAQQN
jgi:NDP-sugar pyrophosphorylase family protein